ERGGRGRPVGTGKNRRPSRAKWRYGEDVRRNTSDCRPLWRVTQKGAKVEGDMRSRLAAIRRRTAGLARRLLVVLVGRSMSSFTLLLAGIAMNSMCSAMGLFLHNFAGLSQSFSIARWTMGGIDAMEYSTLGWPALLLLPAVAVVIGLGKQWNL